MNKKTILLTYAAVILSCIIGIFLYQQQSQPKKPEIKDFIWLNTALTPFELQSANGAFTNKNFTGKWSLIYFGYTYCPDICPTTLYLLQNLMDKLEKTNPEIAKKSQFILVSVDPDRDTAKHLKAYMKFYHKDFIGLTGSVKQIDNLTAQLFGVYEKSDTSKIDYTVNHSGTLHLVSPDGRLVGIFKPPLDPLMDNYAKVISYLSIFFK